MDTKTNYLGLTLKSPIIVGSCGLTSDINNLHKFEEAGAGAVIIKSLFEEEIIHDIKRNTHIFAPIDNYGESYRYIAEHVADDSVSRHFDLIRKAKSELSIPVIGSINCYSYENWINYAKNFEAAGCDAIEINIAAIPFETSLSADDIDRTFNSIISTLKRLVSIPISIKVSTYFTDMAKYMLQLSWMGIQGLTLFSKHQRYDIDIESEQACSPDLLSVPHDLYNTLGWVAVLRNKIRCDISASTGVFTSDDVVKLLLAGARSVQVVSCLYQNGPEHLSRLNEGLSLWMRRKGYDSIDQFCGKLAIPNGDSPSMTMRTRFMRDFSSIL